MKFRLYARSKLIENGPGIRPRCLRAAAGYRATFPRTVFRGVQWTSALKAVSITRWLLARGAGERCRRLPQDRSIELLASSSPTRGRSGLMRSERLDAPSGTLTMAAIDEVLVIEDERLPPVDELSRRVRAARLRDRLSIGLDSCRPTGLGRRLAITTIGTYQRSISPRLRARCLLEPSCSQYALLAIARHGVIRGLSATARRLRRCRPENEGVIDYPKGVDLGLSNHQCRPCLLGEDTRTAH